MPYQESHPLMASNDLTMEQFLVEIEKKAYRMIVISIGDHGDAMDILQDCMIKLVTKYSQHPSEQWKPLFYKMLHNKITDWHRHQKVKNLLFFWKSETSEEGDSKHLDNVADDSSGHKSPIEALEQAQLHQTVIHALSELSVKQQQCFLLRSWEGLSVADTAQIMGCSQGSVKTHYSRAVAKIKQTLELVHDYSF